MRTVSPKQVKRKTLADCGLDPTGIEPRRPNVSRKCRWEATAGRTGPSPYSCPCRTCWVRPLHMLQVMSPFAPLLPVFRALHSAVRKMVFVPHSVQCAHTRTKGGSSNKTPHASQFHLSPPCLLFTFDNHQKPPHPLQKKRKIRHACNKFPWWGAFTQAQRCRANSAIAQTVIN